MDMVVILCIKLFFSSRSRALNLLFFSCHRGLIYFGTMWQNTLSMLYKQLCDWTTSWCISKPGCLSVAYFQKKNSYGGCLFLNYRLSKLWQFIEIYKNLAQYYHHFLTKQPWLMKEWRNLKRKITCNLTHQY